MSSVLEEMNGLDTTKSEDRRFLSQAEKQLRDKNLLNNNRAFSESAHHENQLAIHELAGRLKEQKILTDLKKKYE